MTTLLQISEELLSFRNAVEASVDEFGEIDEEAANALEMWFWQLATDRDAKLDAYVALVRECQLRAAARREEMERLQNRVKADGYLEAKLKERLLLFMQQQGEKKIETERYKLTVAQNGGVLPLEVAEDWEKVLPDGCKRTVTIPDTVAIRNLLKRGIDVPGCKLLPRGQNLRIL